MLLAKLWQGMIRRASRYGSSKPRQRHAGRRLCLDVLENRRLLTGYTITDIGVGPTYGMNNASVVQVIGNNGHAFVWDSLHGKKDLGTFGPDNVSVAYGINDAGQVTGISETITTKVDKKTGYSYSIISSENGFLWTMAQGMQNVGNSTVPIGINNSGEITGTNNSQAALLTGTKWTQLGMLPGGTFSRASEINDYGQVVGYGDFLANPSNLTHAFLWTPSSPNSVTGKMTDLGVLGSTLGSSRASAVNSQGWVTGKTAEIDIAGGADHAYVWKPSSANGTTGVMSDLGTLAVNSSPGLSQSEGVAINRSGVVVGDANPSGVTSQSQIHAVIWQPGMGSSYTVSDLNDLIPRGTGWTLTKAIAINDNGQIVAWTEQGHSLLLTPTTATPSLALPTTNSLTTATGSLKASSGAQGTAALSLVIAGDSLGTPVKNSPSPSGAVPPASVIPATAPSPFSELSVNSRSLSARTASNASVQVDQVFAEFGDSFPDLFDLDLSVTQQGF